MILIENFEFHHRKLLLVVRSKEVHFLVSICSPLIFGHLCGAFDLFFMLSFAGLTFLDSCYAIKVGFNLDDKF